MRLWVLGLCLACGLGLPSIGHAQEQTPAGRAALLLDASGAIGPATADYLRRGIEVAAARNAGLVILRMDTPGGLDASMRDIIRAILASPVPVATYIAPSGARAASAGAYILYASHLAAMAPGTNLGAATPVQLGGGRQPLGGRDRGEDGNDDRPASLDAQTAKAVNDAVAYIRSLAELRGRNADWAERAVRQAASLSANAARESGVIEIVAADVGDLLRQADGRTVRLGGADVALATNGLELIALAPDWRTRLLGVITNPNVAYILLLIGIYGIIFEFLAPGIFFPGVVGAIALILALFSLSLLPFSYAGAALLLLGAGLMTAEGFVSSFGILGIGGVAAFALGSLLLFDGDVPGFTLSLPVIVAATAASAALLAIMLAAVIRAHRRRAVSGEPAMLGSTGRVLAWSGEKGEIRIHGEIWQARAGSPLSPGDDVRVAGRDGLVLVVEPAARTTH